MKFSITLALALATGFSSAVPIKNTKPNLDNVILLKVEKKTNPIDLKTVSTLLRRDSGRSSNSSNYSNNVKVDLLNKLFYYSVNIGLGSPMKQYQLLADTGSSNLWLGNNTKSTSAPYDFAGDTAKKLTNERQHLIYGKGQANILWATTVGEFGKHSLPSVPFGIAQDSRDFNLSDSGIMGLAYSQNGKTNVPQLLKDLGYIKRNAYSLSLNDDNNQNGSLLFGGVDLSKCDGELLTVPRQNVSNIPIKYLATTLSSIKIASQEYPANVVVPLDSGSTITYLPDQLFYQMALYLNINVASMLVSGGPVVDLVAHGDKKIMFSWSGAEITSSVRDLSIPLPDSSRYALFGVFPNSLASGFSIIGSNILRSMYTVYDLDGEQMAICPINKNPESPDIRVIEDGIPESKPAPGVKDLD